MTFIYFVTNSAWNPNTWAILCGILAVFLIVVLLTIYFIFRRLHIDLTILRTVFQEQKRPSHPATLTISDIPPGSETADLPQVPATCLVAVTLAVYVAWMYRAHSRVAPIIPMLLGCIPGLIIGVCVLRVVPGIWLQGGLGAALIVYVAWQLLHRADTAHPESVRGCAVSGFASGFANAAISFSGPPVAIYALYVGWNKDTTRGTLSLYFRGISICTCIVQAAAGLYTPVVVKAALWGMPGALVGLVVSLLGICVIMNISMFKAVREDFPNIWAANLLYIDKGKSGGKA